MLFWNLDRLEFVRRACGEHPTGNAWQPALERLRTEADVALARPVASVMDKPQTPPSGDKHDYYSLGSYWWPDPARPGGLPYVRHDGLLNPEVEQTDRRTLEELLKDAEILTLAGFFFGDERYARRAAQRLRVWFLDPAMRMHPHLEYGQAIPGVCTGRDIGIIDTWFLCRLPDILDLLTGEQVLSDGEAAAIRDWLGQYLHWLQSSAHGQSESRQHNNHGVWYDVQVATFAAATGRTQDARRVLEAASSTRLAPQIAPDGSQPHELARTLSFSYSCFNLQAMFELAALGSALGVDLWHWRDETGRSLRGALDFLVPYADPACAWPHPQIVDKGRTALLPLLRRGTLALNEPAYETAIRQHPEHAAQRMQLVWPRSSAS